MLAYALEFYIGKVPFENLKTYMAKVGADTCYNFLLGAVEFDLVIHGAMKFGHNECCGEDCSPQISRDDAGNRTIFYKVNLEFCGVTAENVADRLLEYASPADYMHACIDNYKSFIDSKPKTGARQDRSRGFWLH
ncbi:MAG: hypothetical protein KGI97_07435 [Alphaproteobacteria bacterium]|nr:hypothetical protein [Alphaproteobacteria bacterium]